LDALLELDDTAPDHLPFGAATPRAAIAAEAADTAPPPAHPPPRPRNPSGRVRAASPPRR
ncbi:hypothetical protein ACE14D_22760, partial [Streptomyces sp. Act-28]